MCHYKYEPAEAGRSGPESAASGPVVVVGPGPVLSGGRSAVQPGSGSGCPDPPAGSTGQGNGQRSCDNTELLIIMKYSNCIFNPTQTKLRKHVRSNTCPTITKGSDIHSARTPRKRNFNKNTTLRHFLISA